MTKTLGEENYEQFAYRYAAAVDLKPHNAFLERPATLSLLPDVSGKRVLDTGCGPGVYADWLIEQGAEVVCCDVTPDMIKLAKERVGTGAEFHLADLHKPLKFAKDEEFDLVLCPLVLDYIEDWLPTFREFYRVLKPGGTFVFSCGHPASDFFVYFHTGNYFNIELTEYPWGGFGLPKPIVKTFRRSLQDLFNPIIQAGLKIDHVLEPRPTQDYKKADPEGYQKIINSPSFICVRSIKA